MSYDDTSFYGDMIVDEYDDKCNFIGTNTPMGYLAYHLLGDGFDLMSEMCSKFMNDFNILTADTRGLDKFWGVSYNMPRPLLYEGQKADYLFVDNGTTASHNDHWYINSFGTATVQSDGTKLLNTSGNISFVMRHIIPSNKTITDANASSYNPPYIVEFDIVETNGTSNSDAQVQIYSQQTTNNFLQEVTSGHYKIEVTSNQQKIWVDDTLIKTTNLSLPNARITLRVRNSKYLIYKNFKVYTGEDKERPLTDDEYKIYLYLRNCRLITKEDLLINFNKCFGFDDYPIVFSDENMYLEATDHLNYEPTDTVSSNLHKNANDNTLHFVTDYSNDETTETIESGLTTEEELVTVINIPYNNWDKEFLEMLEQYISIKGNIKIKEYTL